MLKTLVGLAAVVGLLGVDPSPADACSIKLVGKTVAPRRAVARSARPSSVLVVGDSPRLTRELAAKGHKVEVVADPGAARAQSYGAVVTDQQHAAAAREKYGADHVVVRSSDLSTVLDSVEQKVTLRGPLVAKRNRDAVDRQVRRTPTDAGGGSSRVATTNGGGTATQRPATPPAPPAPPPTSPALTTTLPKGESEVRVPKDARVQNVAKARATGALSEEVFFGNGSSTINRKASIARAVKWLEAHTGTIVVEGYADPKGTAEGNMALSQRRAEAVRDALVSAGVDAARIEVQAFGDTKLHYGRTDGRNRRVLILTKP
jgi:outer membrane protein OmpA-like peptidoglycan-associated protein